MTPKQGCQTTIAASVLDFDDDVVYLQPYHRLWGSSSSNPPHPVFEMLGLFAGYKETQPRLPEDGGIMAAQSLFQVCEEITGIKYPTADTLQDT